MVLNDAKIYYAESTADFTLANVISKVAAYGLPVETVDTVERTYFNSEHLKKYGTGYSDMGDVSLKIELDTDTIEAVEALRAYMIARTEVKFGYIVDKALEDLNVQWAGVITSVSPIDGDITPGVNAQATVVIKPNTRLSAFTEPEA